MISTAHSPRLAARFGQNIFVIRSETPLAEDQMRRAAPSIFAEGKHGSRSDRYTYIPTIDVLRGLRQEGFEPFMVAQSKSRIEGKTEFTKHMIRMRHAGQVNTRPEANEIILINSHDGASSYLAILLLIYGASRLDLRFASALFTMCLLASAAVLVYALVVAKGMGVYLQAIPAFAEDLSTFSASRVLAISLAVGLLVCTPARGR